MGGIGVATKSILNRAGEQNVIIGEYIDNEHKNKYCVEAYNYFFGTNFEKQDINKIDLNSLNNGVDKYDIIIFSLPSNTFTNEYYILKHVKSIEKSLFGLPIIPDRLSIPMSIIDICKYLKPKCIVLDITFQQNGKEQKNNFLNFVDILHNECGYNIDYDVYEAKNFNAPQDRTRTCVVGFEQDIVLSRKFEFPKGVTTPKTIKDIKLDEVDDKYIISNEDWENIYKNSKFVYQRDDDELVKVITANYRCHNAGYCTLVKCDKGSGRRFMTPLETFRAMGLKDDYYYFLSEYYELNKKRLDISNVDNVLYRHAGNSMIGNYMDSLMQNLLNIKEFRVWED